MSRSLSDLIVGTQELRSLPTTTLQLLSLLDDATVDASTVLGVIEKDPSLTANLLKLANSAFYGLRKQVGSAREALLLLGNQTIVNLAFATSMGDIMRGPLAGYRLARHDLWRHSLCTGLAAGHLAARLGEKSLTERAFTAGLVHDIGKLLLNRPLKGHLEQLPPAGTSEQLLDAERIILGFDHAQAGAALAEAWNFPDGLIQVIRTHHSDVADPEGDPLTRVVTAAEGLTRQLGFTAGSQPQDPDRVAADLEILGLGREVHDELVAALPGELEALTGAAGGSL